jgi:hypothetical protein
VVTNNETGAQELFGDRLPTWVDGETLERAVRDVLDGPRAPADRFADARRLVVEQHSYRQRAERLREIVRRWVESPRVGIRIGVPDWEQAPGWGDLHFARALQRQLQRAGRPARVQILPDWGTWTAARDDLSLHLFGLSSGDLRPGQLNVLWQISHPERASPELYERYDIVFVASDPFAEHMRRRVRVPVLPLHQATDDERFCPRPGGPAHELLFVANSRASRRRILVDLLPTDHDLAVYGRKWTPDLLDQRYVRGEYVPNHLLAEYYAAASIVLNDHWPDMRREGFIANRLYDAAAAGAFVISDEVEGLRAEFDDGIVAYETADELKKLVDWYLEHSEERAARAAQARSAVLARHTFSHRVRALLDNVADLEARRPLVLP